MRLVILGSGSTLQLWNLTATLDLQSPLVYKTSLKWMIIRNLPGKFKREVNERQYVVGSPRGGQGRGGEVDMHISTLTIT